MHIGRTTVNENVLWKPIQHAMFGSELIKYLGFFVVFKFSQFNISKQAIIIWG